MATDDAERWEARYASRSDQPIEARMPIALERAGGTTPTDTALDDSALADSRLADFPTSGAALDVASGLGAQTLWLAERGLRVESLDISHTAMASLLKSAEEADLSDRIIAGVYDLDRGLPDQVGLFDVIVCQRFRAPHLYEAFIEHLRPGGWLAMTILSETGASDPGEFHAPPGELTLCFDRPGCILVAHHEADGEESIVLRRTTPPSA